MTVGSNFFVSNIESFQLSAIENGTAHAWLPAVHTQDSPFETRASQPIAAGSGLDYVAVRIRVGPCTTGIQTMPKHVSSSSTNNY